MHLSDRVVGRSPPTLLLLLPLPLRPLPSQCRPVLPPQLLPVVQQPVGALRSSSEVRGQLLQLEAGEIVLTERGFQILLCRGGDALAESLVRAEGRIVDHLAVDALHADEVRRGGVDGAEVGEAGAAVPRAVLPKGFV